MTQEVLGVDIGGVIMAHQAEGSDTSFFGDNYLESPATDFVFEALRALNTEGRFKDNVHIVSKCGKETERKSREWLNHRQFAEVTGIPESRLHFCKKRREKAPICESLGVTHFVDDKLEVLSYLPFVKSRYLYCPRESEVEKYSEHLSSVIRVATWTELLALLQD